MLTDLSSRVIIKEDVLGGLWVNPQMLCGLSEVNRCSFHHSSSQMSSLHSDRQQMCDAPSVFVSDSSSLFAVMELCFHAAACNLSMCNAGCVTYVHRSHVTFTRSQTRQWKPPPPSSKAICCMGGGSLDVLFSNAHRSVSQMSFITSGHFIIFIHKTTQSM